MDYFIKDIDSYKRAINPIKSYREQMIFYLSKVRNIDKDTATNIIDNKLASNSLPIKDKELVCYTRAENGDKNLEATSLLTYIKDTIRNKHILVPTFTNYLPVSVKRSLISGYVEGNVKSRSVLKKEAFVAKAQGDTVKYLFKNNGQNNMKLYNNAMTGAFATMGSVFNNPTAHSTVTSITRMETSLANALNEKIIAGNRHYRSLKVTLNNLNYLAYITDHDRINNTLAKYNLKVPTRADVLKAVTDSTKLYFRDDKVTKILDSYLSKLNGNELASILYTNDLYHVREHNPEFMREMILRITKKTYQDHDNPIEAFEAMPEAIINMTHQLCFNEVKGIGKDYSKIDHSTMCTLLGTANNILDSLEYYKDFLQTFLVTDDIPVSVSRIKDMYRKAVLVSDTDSTMFSADEWVSWWYDGSFKFTDFGYSITAFIGLMASQAIRHVLAVYSANIGMEHSKIFKIQMKSEFVFTSLIQTTVAKHYVAAIAIKEGNVYSKPEMEIKGAHLQNSALGKEIALSTKEKVEKLMDTISSGNKISILQEIKDLIELERGYVDDITTGRKLYFKRAAVKDESAYKLTGEQSPYRHYIFWKAVMEAKYGVTPPPLYRGCVLPLTINNKTDMVKWIANIKDREFADRLSEYAKKTTSGLICTLILPEQYIQTNGIPEEILLVLNIKRIVLDLTLAKRMLLEALGVTLKTDMFASEMFKDLC